MGVIEKERVGESQRDKLNQCERNRKRGIERREEEEGKRKR